MEYAATLPCRRNGSERTSFLEWEVPRDPVRAELEWHCSQGRHDNRFWESRVVRQREIDTHASRPTGRAMRLLYDKPYEDNRKDPRCRAVHRREPLAAPFGGAGTKTTTLLSLSPVEPTPLVQTCPARISRTSSLRTSVTAGVQQARKAGRITFASLEPWPGDLVCAEGRYAPR